MFFCEKSEKPNQLRPALVLNTKARVPDFLWATTSPATAVLRTLVFNCDTAGQVAKFAHQVFAVFPDTALVWPDGF
jgi:hypothetical protein